jgi:ABC-type multidrug transport system fused ATPase/permease subunit
MRDPETPATPDGSSDSANRESPATSHGRSYESDLEEEDDFPRDFGFYHLSPGGTPFSPAMRADHLQTLLMKRHTTVRYLDSKLSDSPSASLDSLTDYQYLTDTTKAKARQERAALQKVENYLRQLRPFFNLDENTVEIHLKDFRYTTKVNRASEKISTVYNEGVCYKLSKWIQRRRSGITKHKEVVDKVILNDINLVLKPSKMYLVLGPPGSGKTSLLRAIAGLLSKANGETTEGSVTYNGMSLDVRCCTSILRHLSI